MVLNAEFVFRLLIWDSYQWHS